MATTQRMTGATLKTRQVGTYGRGLGMALRCYARGQAVSGYYSKYFPGGLDNLWYMVTDGYWVADVDISTGTNDPVTRACSGGSGGGGGGSTPPTYINGVNVGQPSNAKHKWGNCTVQDFRGGTYGWVIVDYTHGTNIVRNAMRQGWIDNGGGPGYGCAKAQEYRYGTGAKQVFDNGPLYWTPGGNTAQKYDRTLAVAFAKANWNATARFPEDCTWFASETLWYAGLPKSAKWTDKTWDLNDVASRGQYPGPSRAAANADYFKNYMVGTWRQATIRQLSWKQNAIPGVQVGDFIGYDWAHPVGKNLVSGHDGVIDHLMTVTSINSSGYANVTGHTDNTQSTGWTWSPHYGNWWETAYYTPGYGPPNVYLIHITY